jgi:hypothetical protein
MKRARSEEFSHLYWEFASSELNKLLDVEVVVSKI